MERFNFWRKRHGIDKLVTRWTTFNFVSVYTQYRQSWQQRIDFLFQIRFRNEIQSSHYLRQNFAFRFTISLKFRVKIKAHHDFKRPGECWTFFSFSERLFTLSNYVWTICPWPNFVNIYLDGLSLIRRSIKYLVIGISCSCSGRNDSAICRLVSITEQRGFVCF